ncbi:hypothetical protein FB451DRAFT_245022 [Mycena latifolia]|nr:hypothetical protein FB451DRAFT_245022 [Mycena latifolia]
MQFLNDEPSFLPPAPTSVLARAPSRSSPSPITPEAVTTSFAANHSVDNSVVRHRRVPRKEEQHSYPPSQSSAPDPVDHHSSAPGGHGIADPAERSARSVGEYLRIVHMFIIAPPCFHDQADHWNLERLDHRLNAFQTWVLTTNGGLLAAPAAILALSSISSSPFAQSFVILAGIFALYGVIYTIMLVFHIGECKTQFLFLLQQERAEGMDRSRSSWTPSTAMCLPLAWMAWFERLIILKPSHSQHIRSIVSLLFSLITLGVQGFVSAFRHLSSSNDASNSSPPTPALFNIFQLGAFTLAIVWSSVHVVMLYIQVRHSRLKACERALRQHNSELEAGN